MTIGTSIFLIAVGAILRYAVTWTLAGVNLHTVGLILMIAGLAGLGLSLLWMFQPARRQRSRRPGPAPEPEPPYGAPYEPRAYDGRVYDEPRGYDDIPQTRVYDEPDGYDDPPPRRRPS